jgi:hypothetical protein
VGVGISDFRIPTFHILILIMRFSGLLSLGILDFEILIFQDFNTWVNGIWDSVS